MSFHANSLSYPAIDAIDLNGDGFSWKIIFSQNEKFTNNIMDWTGNLVSSAMQIPVILSFSCAENGIYTTSETTSAATTKYVESTSEAIVTTTV